jgi:serine/threonine-protein kinase
MDGMKTFQQPVPGERIQHPGRAYTIGERIGQGAYSSVFACTDDWDNVLVAKVLWPHNQPYEDVRERWMHELRMLVELRHPNITFVHDAFEYRDTFYLVLERCTLSLGQLIAVPDLQRELWILPVARCVLQAIHFIHLSGYIHKDLHLENVHSAQVRDEINPCQPGATVFKVADLGISRLVREVDVFNTLLAPWMLPPEYLMPGEFGYLGQGVDIYHAGLLFLALLLGAPPSFTRDEIVAGKPRMLAEGVHPGFGPVIARALRRHVRHRTQTALQFWQELRSSSSASGPLT